MWPYQYYAGSGGKVVATSPPPPPTVLLLETFAGDSSTVLNGKLPSIGNVWHANILPQQGDDTNCLRINDSAQCVAVANQRHSSGLSDVGESDCTTTMVANITSPGNMAIFTVFRVVNFGTYMIAGLTCADGSTVFLSVQACTDGAFSDVLSQIVSAPSGGYTITVAINSDSFTVGINSVNILSGSHPALGVGSTSLGFMQYIDDVALFPPIPVALFRAVK